MINSEPAICKQNSMWDKMLLPLQKRKCQTVSVEVKKSQHKYVVGPRYANIQDILAKTGVSVEVPDLNSPSETITLRGEQEKLGSALTEVSTKVSSYWVVDIDFTYTGVQLKLLSKLEQTFNDFSQSYSLDIILFLFNGQKNCETVLFY